MLTTECIVCGEQTSIPGIGVEPICPKCHEKGWGWVPDNPEASSYRLVNSKTGEKKDRIEPATKIKRLSEMKFVGMIPVSD